MKIPDLRYRQEAGAKVEKMMIDFLLQYTPVADLKVKDVQVIAMQARSVAFACFDDER